MSQMAQAIRALIDEKGYSKESVKDIITATLKAAYKRTFSTDENAIVKFNEDMSDVSLYARKVVVDGVYDPAIEIELDEAKKLSADCEEGDEIDLLIDPKTFERSAVAVGKQSAKSGLSHSMQDHLYEEYKDRIGQIVSGNFVREHNGSVYIDMGKVEGIIPKKYQSPREEFHAGDRIKAFCVDARKSNAGGLQLVLSRIAPELVRQVMEMEVPEIADGTIEIVKIVHEAGYRSKVALTTHKEDVDPVGACVGQRGARVQSIINELGGERIDVLRYDANPIEYIKNALSPAQVEKVVIVDEAKKQAMAIVSDTQFSLAIGTKGQNVRLANKLVDWVIDVKPESQCEDIDLSVYDGRKAYENLFTNNLAQEEKEEQNSLEKKPDLLDNIKGIDERLVALLHASGIQTASDYSSAKLDGVIEKISGIAQEDIAILDKALGIPKEEQEVAQAETTQEISEQEVEEDEYFCPECGQKITLDMTKCPNCGIEFTFEDEE